MRGVRSLLVLTIVAAGLGAYIYFVESRRDPTAVEQKDTLFTIESEQIEELRVTSAQDETTVLAKQEGGAWQVTEPLAIRADAAEVSGIVSNLSNLEIQRVVEENAADLSTYGLADPRIEVAFKVDGDAEYRRLLIGSKTATGGDLYAKQAADERVVLISGFLEGTFNRSPFDLRDKTVVTSVDSLEVDRVEIDLPDEQIVLAKGADWRMVEPWESRADFGVTQNVISQLTTSQMKSIVAAEPTPEELTQYGFDSPAAVVTLQAGDSKATVEFGHVMPDDDTSVYARELSRPAVFLVEKTLRDDVAKSPSDFRKKDVFEFRPFNVERFELTHGGQTFTFERTKNAQGEDIFRQTSPVARELPKEQAETAFSATANLRALYFVDPETTRTGLDTPTATIEVRYQEGKVDRVRFGQDDQDVFAAYDGEPGAARLDTKDFQLAVKAINDLSQGTSTPSPTEGADQQ